MNITLDKPVTITVQPQTMAVILDLLARNLPYSTAKPIIEDELVPQLVVKEEPSAEPRPE